MVGQTSLFIDKRLDGGVVSLALRGDLDLSTRRELGACLCKLRERGEDVRLDLSRLDFIDAAGAGLLIRAQADSRARAWTLRFDPRLSPQVAKVFELIGFSPAAA